MVVNFDIVIRLHQIYLSGHRVEIEFCSESSTTNTGASRSPTLLLILLLLNVYVKLPSGIDFVPSDIIKSNSIETVEIIKFNINITRTS